jgi:hypothetical protein
MSAAAFTDWSSVNYCTSQLSADGVPVKMVACCLQLCAPVQCEPGQHHGGGGCVQEGSGAQTRHEGGVVQHGAGGSAVNRICSCAGLACAR